MKARFKGLSVKDLSVTWGIGQRKPSLFAVLVIMPILSGLAARDAIAEESYPIWWSPSLELASLEQIDERLARALPPVSLDLGPMALYPDGEQNAEKREPRTCAELLDLRDRGYRARTKNGTRLMSHFESWCRAVAAFKTAEPAARSFVRDFVFDRDAVNFLPAFVVPAYSCYAICLQKEAHDRRIPLAKLHAPLAIARADGRRLVIETSLSRESVEIIGRADFTEDGREDLLVIGTSTTLKTKDAEIAYQTRYYLLTRDTLDGVLTVADIDRHLCPGYPCAAPNEQPTALDETE